MKKTEKKNVQTPNGQIEMTVTEVDPIPQEIKELSSEELQSIKSDANRAAYFIASFTNSYQKNDYTLKHLDHAFEGWINSGNQSEFNESEVIKIVGSAFGEYCVKNLNMRWVKVSDKYGTDYAIRSQVKDIMGFPYSSVLKSINAKEHTFMIPVYCSLKQEINSNN